MHEWDETVDFLIIGSGGGGLAAAVSARERGLDTLLIEKMPVLGGSTALSGGVLWLPANPLMSEAGIPDSVEAGLEYFAATVGDAGPVSSVERRRAFIEGGAELVSLLRSKGIPFERADGYSDYYSDAAGGSDRGRTIEPLPFDAKRLGEWRTRVMPGMAKHIGFVVKTNELRKIQYFNRTLRTFIGAGVVAARTWTARILKRDVWTNGAALIGQMLRLALDAGARVWLSTPLERLIVDDDGRVIGVEVTHEGATKRIRALNGVLLAAGGFAHNKEMRAQHSGNQPNDGRWAIANPGDTGEVLRMAMELGLPTVQMDEAWWLPSTRRELGASTLGQIRQRPGGILVDTEGRRFVNEANSMVEVGKAMYARNSVPCWGIADEGYRRRYTNGLTLPGHMPKEWFDNGWVKTADTLEKLATKIGVNPSQLAETVRTFNVHAEKGLDPEFGRGASAYNKAMGDPGFRGNPAVGALSKAPYYAVEIFPADVGTCGGLIANEHGQVLDAEGTAVPGLYATGNITGSVMGRSYLGAGGSIAYTLIFGHLAAKHAATTTGAEA